MAVAAHAFRSHRRSSRACLALGLGALLFGLAAFARERDVAPVAGALTGRDWNGARYDLTADAGRVRLVFFGYTHCPDVCPGSFARARRLAGELLPAEVAELSIVFVSVDPERDTPDVLANYVAAFDTRFHGLALTPDELATTLAGFRAVAHRRAGGEGGFYTLDHTSSFFLIDRAGRLRTTLAFDGEFATLLREVRALLAEPLDGAALAPPPVNHAATPAPAAAPDPVHEPAPLAEHGGTAVLRAALAPTPGAVAAVYLTLANRAPGVERLLAVRSPAAASELHETVHDGEVAEMLPRPEGFAFGPGETLELAPGGKHVMLFDLPGALAPGDALELVLVCARAGEIPVTVPVEARP